MCLLSFTYRSDRDELHMPVVWLYVTETGFSSVLLIYCADLLRKSVQVKQPSWTTTTKVHLGKSLTHLRAELCGDSLCKPVGGLGSSQQRIVLLCGSKRGELLRKGKHAQQTIPGLKPSTFTKLLKYTDTEVILMFQCWHLTSIHGAIVW